MNEKTESVNAAAITPLEMPVPDAPAVSTPAAAPASSTATETPSAPAPGAKLDRKGTPFDPARHLDKLHPVSGCWIPKGGRKKGSKNAAPSSAVQTSFIPTEEPPPSVTATAEKTETTAATAEPAKTAATEETKRDCSGEAAECATSAAEFVAGLIFDAPEDVALGGKHRDNLVKHAQGFIQSKGWQFTAGAALFVVLLAWLLKIASKPKPREKIRSWVSRPEERARNVTPPAGAPKSDTAAPVSPRPVSPGSSQRPGPGCGPIIEIPSHIPPLA